MRGDDPWWVPGLGNRTGTPPRARGRPPHPVTVAGVTRNTPACAGTTLVCSHVSWPKKEHPRVRGDDTHVPPSGGRHTGTPPRARGRLVLHPAFSIAYRNTPACAGTTRSRGQHDQPHVQHPRVRGDDEHAGRYWHNGYGTPPRARGRLRQHPSARFALGNTPACAGTTSCQWSSPPPTGEHPRVRGDDSILSLRLCASIGTPPRARGRLRQAVPPPVPGRNTPACAGTTEPRAAILVESREHPRVRGDDRHAARGRTRPGGTPPRARGRPAPHAAGRCRVGNTPACAGTTFDTLMIVVAAPEHPRVRGDDQGILYLDSIAWGTPPRARGRPTRARYRWSTSGNTPACAGTTYGGEPCGSGRKEHPRVRGDD